jgi:hypothetical protein
MGQTIIRSPHILRNTRDLSVREPTFCGKPANQASFCPLFYVHPIENAYFSGFSATFPLYGCCSHELATG